MTAYQGGKKRIGKRIATRIKEIEQELGYENLDYFEPFCGMCGVLIHMFDDKRKIIANDINKDIITMWNAVQDGWLPPYKTITEEYWNNLKDSKTHSPERGFYGVVCSFGAMFFGSFRSNKKRSYIDIGINNIIKTREKVSGVSFKSKSYSTYRPKGKLIYCDPPYVNNNLSNKLFTKFDHVKFWDKMRDWSERNVVLISELEAPEDFKCIWEKKYTIPIHTHGVNKRNIYSEKLFIHEKYFKVFN